MLRSLCDRLIGGLAGEPLVEQLTASVRLAIEEGWKPSLLFIIFFGLVLFASS
jgi:hypothetical protein